MSSWTPRQASAARMAISVRREALLTLPRTASPRIRAAAQVITAADPLPADRRGARAPIN